MPVSSPAEVAQKAARLRTNQVAWAARPLAERVGVMRRWIGELLAKSREIAAADGADTGGCHTSQFQAFIAVANISGWAEDAAGVMERARRATAARSRCLTWRSARSWWPIRSWA